MQQAHKATEPRDRALDVRWAAHEEKTEAVVAGLMAQTCELDAEIEALTASVREMRCGRLSCVPGVWAVWRSRCFLGPKIHLRYT